MAPSLYKRSALTSDHVLGHFFGDRRYVWAAPENVHAAGLDLDLSGAVASIDFAHTEPRGHVRRARQVVVDPVGCFVPKTVWRVVAQSLCHAGPHHIALWTDCACNRLGFGRLLRGIHLSKRASPQRQSSRNHGKLSSHHFPLDSTALPPGNFTNTTEGQMAQQDTQAAGSGQTIKTHPLLDVARDLVITDQKASISYVQRKLNVGYNDAATLLDTLELEGVVSKPGPDFTRTVLSTKTASNNCNAPVMAEQFTQAAGSGQITQGQRPLPVGARSLSTSVDIQGDLIQVSVYVFDERGQCHLADLTTSQVRKQRPSDTADALLHLWRMAQGASSSEKVAARFLLGLYNGYRFPFDLTDFRLFDGANFKRAQLVLAMDHMPKAEVHVVLGNLLGRSGRDMGAQFEHLAFNRRFKGHAKKSELPTLREEVAA